MITYKDCPECGANKIHSSVRLCEVCETCEKYESKITEALRERDEACEELEVLRGLIEGEPWAGAVLRRDFVHLQERVEAAGEIISANGCDCECDHDAESHDEDCERCLACRISSALWPSVSK